MLNHGNTFLKIPGVLSVFKGFVLFFLPELYVKNIGYHVKIENATLEFVPLEAKLPFKYCPSIFVKPSDKPCLEDNYDRQLISFTKY